MTGLQRINATILGAWPDKRPVMLHNFMMAAREAGMTMRQFRSDPVWASKAFIQAGERYDLDGILIDIDTATLAGAVGVGIDYPEDEPARAMQPCLSSLAQVDDLCAVEIAKNERVQIWLETCRLVKAHFGKEKFVRGNCDQAPFSLASMMRSPADWMMDILSADEKVHRLLEFCTTACIQFIKLVAETGVDMVSNGDSPAGPEMISPALYRNFALPYERQLVQAAHQLNKPYALHICGNTDAILGAMLETTTDALELDYKTDIDKIRTLFKVQVTFIGNLDPTGVLRNGTWRDVEAKVTELLRLYQDSPRLIINAGCALPPDTPSENIRKLVKVCRSF